MNLLIQLIQSPEPLDLKGFTVYQQFIFYCYITDTTVTFFVSVYQ